MHVVLFCSTVIFMSRDVLIIDDDRTEQRLVKRVLQESLQLNSVSADNGREGLQLLKRRPDIGLAILDLDMPVMNGHEVLEELRRDYAHIPTIVLTGSRDMQDAVRAMKGGAFDFLAKPVNQNSLVMSARNALKLSVLAKVHEVDHTEKRFSFDDLLGHDAGLSACVEIGRKAAASQLPVLIQGETGTGKEMFAQAIHGESTRAAGPFVAVNCGAIPEKLIESTLFGHEKGAFTGAVSKAIGKFREADGGTLFLDEIGELPLEAQVKMLRALQQQEIEPVGAAKSVKVDVRVISATNRKLAEEVEGQRFREDLYFRLNVLQILLPPLRARTSDIEKLAQHFVAKSAYINAQRPKSLSDEAMKLLQLHNWSGNVRELENVIYRAMALSDGDVITEQDIIFTHYADPDDSQSNPFHVAIADEDGAVRALKEIEQEIIGKALRHLGQNMTQTAKSLGIAKSTLYSKIDGAE